MENETRIMKNQFIHQDVGYTSYSLLKGGNTMGKRGDERTEEQNKEYGRQGKYSKNNKSEKQKSDDKK